MARWLPPWSNLFTHVKWFAHQHLWYPESMSKVITPVFLFWLAFTLVALLIAAICNEKLEKYRFINQFHFFLNKLKRFQLTIFRIGVGLGFLLQLCTGTYLSPSFVSNHIWVYLFLIAAMVGLLHRKLLLGSGLALTALYITAIVNYGIFQVLDYVFYVGIIYYLCFVNTRWSPSINMVLYFFTGLSLAWIAMEKLTIPELAYSLVHDYHLPTMGFSVDQFVLISAFIELGLAWAFIVGLLNRFSAFLLTSIFILTTAVFGFTEIVGHTIVHTILILFIINGNDGFKTFFKFHRTLTMRCLFVVINFCVMLFGLLTVYISLGQWSFHI
ncbi:hypothetical protein GRF59_26795 [Paenibacillus sp. HJL G12]|uniref:DoxX family membrane protein n=1 Tax=Paenibacillus dendrobii TaxID=2691084 RepID=A0A7X3IS36_9BACL|nr:hypothetical protein [Paenibacillus dendrobii]MWV47207.1 hypothetical protein [Paenibacillus dendrobii]